MSTRTDPRFEAYLEKSPAFARAILEHLRALVNDVCPQVHETLKWQQAAFTYRGKIVCMLGIFKAHCGFHCWHPGVGAVVHRDFDWSEEGSGQTGRLTCLADLPPDATLRRSLEAAVEHLDAGEPDPPRRPAAAARKPEPAVPADLAALLQKNPAATHTFQSFPPGHRREYLAWIADAKRPVTRARRLATTIEWLTEGKGFGWKYQPARG